MWCGYIYVFTLTAAENAGRVCTAERSARVSRLCMEKVWGCILLVAYSLRNKERQFHFEIVKIP